VSLLLTCWSCFLACSTTPCTAQEMKMITPFQARFVFACTSAAANLQPPVAIAVTYITLQPHDLQDRRQCRPRLKSRSLTTLARAWVSPWTSRQQSACRTKGVQQADQLQALLCCTKELSYTNSMLLSSCTDICCFESIFPRDTHKGAGPSFL